VTANLTIKISDPKNPRRPAAMFDSLENVQKQAFLIISWERFANRTCSYHEFCREVRSISLAVKVYLTNFSIKWSD